MIMIPVLTMRLGTPMHEYRALEGGILYSAIISQLSLDWRQDEWGHLCFFPKKACPSESRVLS